MIGRTLSHYKVLEKIGEGGMGEIYLAKDTKLDREVAVKVLPSAFSENKERLARFEREAKLLASLNHPNIAAIHELEESDGVHFLALEYVPGETLAERIKRGPIFIDEALPLFKQIAEGLEAAHEKGVIHRDLKPANIKVTPEGKVKVLDFGLAKAMAGETPFQGLSESPTITRDDTETGVLLGTAPYMSPEQARGKRVDKRTDIWAFGCCLYEALTGKVAFLGETVSDTIAATLDREPDWHALPETTPVSFQRLLQRCLNKDSGERLQHIGDARIEIKEVLAERALPVDSTTAERRTARWKQAVPWGLAALALAVSIAFWNLWRPRVPNDPAQTGAMRFALTLPEGFVLPQDTYGYAISTDGKKVVVVASRGTDSRLYLRKLDQTSFEEIPGTEGARFPFFSPDGEWVGFTTEDCIKKMFLGGGTPQVLCEDCRPTSSAPDWAVDDSIFFGSRTGLWRISASGGRPELLAAPDSTQVQATLFLWPEFLPDEETVLFTISGGGRTSIALLSLETGEWRTLLEGGSQPHYMPTGHLVYAHDGQLMAVPLDPKTLDILGDPTPFLETLAVGFFSTNFDASENGTLVYVPRKESKLVWRDHQGNAHVIPAPARDYREPDISPDGKRVAVNIVEGAARDIWVYDLERGTLTRLTFGKDEWFTLWTPDGENIVFTSGRAGQYNLYMKRADGSGDAEQLTVHEHQQKASSWSPDGRVLLLNVVDPDTGGDIYQLTLDEDRTLTPFLKTPFFELNPKFSPDGRWVAYGSTESGRWEVYVRAYPSGEKQMVSVEGGRQPIWHPNGRELFFASGSNFMAVSFSARPAFHVGAPRVLFELSSVPGLNNENIDISPDGERFLVADRAVIRKINVVLNWFEELKRLVPVN